MFIMGIQLGCGAQRQAPPHLCLYPQRKQISQSHISSWRSEHMFRSLNQGVNFFRYQKQENISQKPCHKRQHVVWHVDVVYLTSYGKVSQDPKEEWTFLNHTVHQWQVQKKSIFCLPMRIKRWLVWDVRMDQQGLPEARELELTGRCLAWQLRYVHPFVKCLDILPIPASWEGVDDASST